MRQFEVRIGINENVDNVVLDINRRRNVAGHGISMTQRIMDKADGGQLLVGRATYDILNPREKYQDSFQAYQATAKHGVTFPVYQFRIQSAGLNIDIPSAFVEHKPQPSKLTKLAAYYLAHAAKNRQFLLSRTGDHRRDDAAIVLLGLLAEDSVEKAECSPLEKPSPITWQAETATFEKQYQYYRDGDFWVMIRASQLTKQSLKPYASLFEGDAYDRNYAFVRQAAIKRVQEEYPLIAKEFGFAHQD